MNATHTSSLILFRAKLLDWAGTLKSPQLLQRAVSMVYPGPVTLDYRPVIYCAAVAANGTNVYNDFRSKYLLARSEFEKLQYLRALACVAAQSDIQT